MLMAWVFLCLDTRHPVTDVREVIQGHAAFGRERHIRVTGDVRNRRTVASQPGSVCQMAVQNSQGGFAAFLALRQVKGAAEPLYGPRPRQPILDFIFRHRQPLHHAGHGFGLDRQPLFPAMAASQIDQNRHGVPDDRPLILQNRYLPARIQGQKCRILVFPSHQVDRHGVVVDAQQGSEQPDLVAIAG
ncbi:MAG: hypothetical protein H6R26_1347 [Proteobacteria bacterium]|nr:hypothetical protein [Pseudomonadota bacterium]